MSESKSSRDSSSGPGKPARISNALLNDASLIGRLLIDQGLADMSQVRQSLSRWKELGQKASDDSLYMVMVNDGVATRQQLEKVRKLAEQQRTMQQIPGYQLLERLGAGAMAVVFKARQLSLDRMVAIKVLPKKFMNDPNFIERFYAEGRAAAKLNHPNIVQAIDVGQAGDFHYFVMEFVEGHTVHDHIEKYTRYPEHEAIRVITQVTEALHHAHQRGLVHRDVKPKNIMITPAGVAKLADMGLARVLDDEEMAKMETGKAVGTPYYISPEQIRGVADVDRRADIYGLGATFYHMVTGRVPFDGPNPSAVMHKHLKEELILPDHINHDLSEATGQVIEVMMAKDRKQRYQNATDLIEDLRAIAAGQPPLHASKQADFSSLELPAIEEEKHAASKDRLVVADQFAPAPSILEQPVFWAAIASILLNLVLVFLLVMMLSK